MKKFYLSTLLLSASAFAAVEMPKIPDQNKGIAYTRSSAEFAQKTFSQYIAVSPLSRYMFIYGKKVRFDNTDKLRGEALVIEGETYFPIDAVGYFALKPSDKPKKIAPAYLKDRWRYEFDINSLGLNNFDKAIKHKGRHYVSLEDIAEHYQLKLHKLTDKVFFLSKKRANIKLSALEIDNITSQFDTPEKYLDPTIASKTLPQLIRQGEWTKHVKLKGDEGEILAGPEPEWEFTEKKTYDLDGFNFSLLGSDLPKAGTYPRLLFSEKDLPAIRKRIKDNAIARRTFAKMEVLLGLSWLKEGSSDAEVFAKLAKGETKELTWDAWAKGRRIPHFPGKFDSQKPGIYCSHIAYNSQSLSTIALIALINNDDALGKKAAKAIANLYRLHDKNIDKFLAFSDSELGSNSSDSNASTTQWRGISAAVAHMDLPFCLDFAGKWMNAEDKKFMIEFTAKVTYGRRNNGGDGPRRAWRDINHMTWHMTHLLALATIEGTEGFDEEAYLSGEELVHDFLQWGISPEGTMYESNGKSSAGTLFQFYNMAVMARRGNNLWGHPHLKNLLRSQAMNTSPNGETTVSSGTWSGNILATPLCMIYHSFFPEDPYADYALTITKPSAVAGGTYGFDPQKFNETEFRKELAAKPGRTRLPSPQYPAFTLTLLYDTDWDITERKDLPKETEYLDEVQGHLSAYSEQDNDATWLNLQVRPNHYLGAGHHHADAGMFHFSSGGINWITESAFLKQYDGKYHNQVLIDGIAQPDGIMGRPKWLGSSSTDKVFKASCDLTDSYSYRTSSQFIYFDTDHWGPRPDQYEWTLYRDPVVIDAAKGTQRYKMRPWWATQNFSNWFPVIKRDFNPVQYAYRTAAMIKGKNPYALIIDDLKKDDKERLYQWSAMPGAGVWAATTKDYQLPVNQLVLAHKGEARHHADQARIRPKKGDPLLLVCLLGGEGRPKEFESGPSKQSRFALNPYDDLSDDVAVSAPIRIETRGDGPHWRNSDQVQFFYDQIIGGCYSKKVNFRTLLIPFKHGEKIPQVQYDKDKQRATIKFAQHTDTINFFITKNRTDFKVNP